MMPATKEEPEAASVIDFLPDHQVKQLTEDQKKGLKRAIDPSGYLSLTPMICKDYACPIFDKCALNRLNIPRPVGDDCPLESAQLRTWQQQLFKILPTEEQGDPYNVMMVNDIALIELIEQRAMAKMAADGGDIEQEITVGHTPDGRPLVSKDVNRSLAVFERFNKVKLKLMAKLLQTPQDRAKAAAAGMYDRSRKAAELMDKMKEIVERTRVSPAEAKARQGEGVVDAEFTVVEEGEAPIPLPDESF